MTLSKNRHHIIYSVKEYKTSGGRPRQNLTREQEQELLTPFLEQAAAGGVLVVAPVQAA